MKKPRQNKLEFTHVKRFQGKVIHRSCHDASHVLRNAEAGEYSDCVDCALREWRSKFLEPDVGWAASAGHIGWPVSS